MIVELLQLADRLGVTGQEAFARRPIHWFIDLDEDGNFLGLSPTVARAEKKKGDWSEEVGKEYPCPRFLFMEVNKKGDVKATAGGGRAVAELGAGNVVEIWGVHVEMAAGGAVTVSPLPEKDQYKHQNFVDLHSALASAEPACTAAQAVSHYLASKPEFPKDLFREPSRLKRALGQQFSFRVAGRMLTSDAAFKAWWEEEWKRRREAVQQKLPRGKDAFPLSQLDRCEGWLTLVFPHIAGVPGGGGWCPLASFDKAPSQSYGLGNTTVSMRLEVAEKSASALNWLLRDEASHLRLGDSVAVFWAAQSNGHAGESEAPPFARLLSEGDPLQVRDFIRGVWGSRPEPLDHQRFHAAILSSPQSRVTVRSWHTDTLPRAVDSLRRWLAAASLPDRGGEEGSVSIMDLAACTVRKSKDSSPLPATYIALFEAALFGGRIPSKLLTAALMRQGLELATGCDKKARKEFEARLRARTALIKLYFEITKGETMSPEMLAAQDHPAYLYGRLLALLDKIHEEAHKDDQGRVTTKSSPANRAYAAASTTPALIFPQLCKVARYHLAKIPKGNPKRLSPTTLEFGRQGEEGLAQIVARLEQATGGSFHRTLPLEDQGRFAIGFYTERCRWRGAKAGSGDVPPEPGSDEPDTGTEISE